MTIETRAENAKGSTKRCGGSSADAEARGQNPPQHDHFKILKLNLEHENQTLTQNHSTKLVNRVLMKAVFEKNIPRVSLILLLLLWSNERSVPRRKWDNIMSDVSLLRYVVYAYSKVSSVAA